MTDTFDGMAVVPLHFVTDQRPCEPDILSSARQEPLVVSNLDGEVLWSCLAPAGGWTHELICQAGSQVWALVQEGADAHLGKIWVGSTEV